MSDKVLFWISRDHIHFGIAKSMMEKFDINSYAIVESNDYPRKFYKTQDLVKFSKVWFFDEEISYSNKKPDIEFLTNFETQFNIKLWQIAYSERQFLHYNKYYKFSSNEIMSILEQECKLFLKILDEVKPDFLAIRLTDFHNVDLMDKLCKAKGIKVLMLTPANLNNTWMVSESTKLDYLECISVRNQIDFVLNNSLQNYWQQNNPKNMTQKYIMSSSIGKRFLLKNIKSICRQFLTGGKETDKNRLTLHGKTNSKIFKNIITVMLQRYNSEKFIDKYGIKNISTDENFVFFPLHVEPERSTLIASPFFNNQLELIERISKSLPIDYVLYVKEHPIMKTRYWRPLSFYKKLQKLPNVKLVHPLLKNEEIFPHASLVITVTGTSGLEGIFFKKPAVVFGDTIYSHLSFVARVRNLDELPYIIKKQLNTKINTNELNEFLNIFHENTFKFDMNQFFSEENPFSNELIKNSVIDKSTMKKFLLTFSNAFEQLSEEHMKKIKLHKLMSKENK